MNLSLQEELQPFAEELQRYITPVFIEELAILIIQSYHISLAGFFESVYS
ncbi:hypothetical protein P9W85_20075 [Bacillus tropicus]|nr:hypothetical protein [Bacillus tropicus]MCC1488748.1 hypothetical protein [Bacillus tropicus]MEC2553666.1 hypothetical protein [Bacillus tropicus]